MKLKNRMVGLARTSSNVMQSKCSRSSVHRQQADLMNRVRGINCMLTDIEVEIQRLRNERVYLCLVQRDCLGAPLVGASADGDVLLARNLHED